VARRGDREREQVRPQGVPLDERGGSAPIVIAVLREAVVDPVDSTWTRWRRPNLGSTGRTREPAQRGRRAGPARTSHRPARPHLPGRVLADVPAASRQTHQSIGTVRNYLAAPIGELGVASRSKAFRTAPTTLVVGVSPSSAPGWRLGGRRGRLRRRGSTCVAVACSAGRPGRRPGDTPVARGDGRSRCTVPASRGYCSGEWPALR
jgi:hypothetical protein